MSNLNVLGVDVVTGQYKPYAPGTDTINEPSLLSAATTGNSLLLSAVSLTSGSFLRGIFRIPDSPEE